MFGLILLLMICGFIGMWLWRVDGGIAMVVPLILFIFFVVPAIGLTGGLIPDYSVGTRDGYITKMSRKGLMWKTNENEMQVGTGNMAALQEPFEFSIMNSTLLPQLEEAANEAQRVRVHYTQYLIADLRHAESRYVVVNVGVLDGEKD
jgi:hypothetical protein